MRFGIHYPTNVNYEFSELNKDNNIIQKNKNSVTEEDKINIENYYISKCQLDETIVKILLTESKLLNTTEILKYNLASEVIEKLPDQYQELKKRKVKVHLVN